jgi:hypothetical protein
VCRRHKAYFSINHIFQQHLWLWPAPSDEAGFSVPQEARELVRALFLSTDPRAWEVSRGASSTFGASLCLRMLREPPVA